MKKTIAIIASLDTKIDEVRFCKELLEDLGVNSLIIDISLRGRPSLDADISRDDVLNAASFTFEKLKEKQKDEKISAIQQGIELLLPQLYKNDMFDGVLGLGGLQNTVMATAGMRALALGIPKLMVSTVACGQRKFESFVGSKDILMMPAIADMAGLNPITCMVLQNAVSAIWGMVKLKKTQSLGDSMIGTTLMGITNDGVMNAVELLKQKGFCVASFHSTGVGGRVMEELIKAGSITAVIDLTLHELTGELAGCGYSYGANDRLIAGATKGIPMVVAPGGVDFYCIDTEDFLSGKSIGDPSERKYILHNKDLAHIKLNADEISRIGMTMAKRLNMAKGPVTVLLPLKGCRMDTQMGEKLYDPDVDAALFNTLKNNLSNEIKIVEVDANFNDEEFSQKAVDELLLILSDTYRSNILEN